MSPERNVGSPVRTREFRGQTAQAVFDAIGVGLKSSGVAVATRMFKPSHGKKIAIRRAFVAP